MTNWVNYKHPHSYSYMYIFLSPKYNLPMNISATFIQIYTYSVFLLRGSSTFITLFIHRYITFFNFNIKQFHDRLLMLLIMYTAVIYYSMGRDLENTAGIRNAIAMD